jgi:hypothetical protein
METENASKLTRGSSSTFLLYARVLRVTRVEGVVRRKIELTVSESVVKFYG